MPSAGSLITFATLVLSILAVGLASFAIWQQRQNTADIAALMPVSNGDAGESTDIANSDLADRLAALESQLAADRQSQQAALAALQDQMATPAPAPPITAKIMIPAVMPKPVLPPFVMIWINALPRLRRHWPTKPCQ